MLPILITIQLNEGRDDMRTNRSILLVLFVLLAAGACLAQGEYQKALGNLTISAIKKMQVMRDPTACRMEVVAIVSNENAESMKLRNGSFEVSFHRPGGSITLGTAQIREQEVYGKNAPQQGTTVMNLNVYVGPNNDESVNRLIAVFNIVGNPDARLEMIVKGLSEVGLQLPKGWVFARDLKAEVELRFTPAIQREILLK